MTPCDGNTFTRNLNYGATTEDRTVGMVLRCASNMLVANNTFAGIQYFEGEDSVISFVSTEPPRANGSVPSVV